MAGGACVPQKHLTPQRDASNYDLAEFSLKPRYLVDQFPKETCQFFVGNSSISWIVLYSSITSDPRNDPKGHEKTTDLMTELKCEVCGAELLPGTGFCRQCGTAITGSGAIESSEQPTAIFPNHDAATTLRLRPRPTSPTSPAQQPAPRRFVRRNVFLLLMLIVLLLGIVATVAVLSDRNLGTAPSSPALLYPGATTVVDMSHADGGRTVHLQTPDALDRVESWYHNNLELDKTVRLTSNSVILKNRKVTITLAVEDGKTNILIKQGP